MEQADELQDECEVTVEVLPETVTEVVYLSEQSSPDIDRCSTDRNCKGELHSSNIDETLTLEGESNTYVVLTSGNESTSENYYISEEELQKNYFIVNNPVIGENAMRNVLYTCESCNSEFEDYQELLDHFNIKHPVFECNICGCSCISENTLMSHYKTHEPKHYCCDICGVEYENSIDFENHKKTHSTNLLYACNICDAPFATTYNVSLHIRTEHSKQRNTKTKPDICDNVDSTKRLKR